MVKNTIIVVLLLIIIGLLVDKFSLNVNKRFLSSFLQENSMMKKEEKKGITTLSFSENTPSQKNALKELLQSHQFYEALNYFLEHNTSTNKKSLESYIFKQLEEDFLEGVNYLHSYLNEFKERKFLRKIIDKFVKENHLKKAIELMVEDREAYLLEEEDEALKVELRRISKSYLKNLLKEHQYTKAIAFLEEMILYGDENFYTFLLAKLYNDLEKKALALETLSTIEEDELYQERVQALIKEIKSDEEEGYHYHIPLIKEGVHYLIACVIEGNPFKLLLDTGASYTLIDENKGEMLGEVLNTKKFSTAGGDIEVTVIRVNFFEIEEIRLESFILTLADFDKKRYDGLLGMNFLKHFEFYIDQEKNILHLNPKE